MNSANVDILFLCNNTIMKITAISTQKLAHEAGKALNKKLALSKNKPYLLMLSGGSSLALLEYLDTRLFGDQTTIAVTDERFSKDEKENNFALVMTTDFYKKAKECGAKFIDTRVEDDETLEEHGKRFESELKKWRSKNPESFIYAAIGIGSDGHVAGIMPYPFDTSLFYKHFQSEKWVVGYNAGMKNPFSLRSTITLSFIRGQISFAVSYISGENKRLALEKVLASDGTLMETPARILREVKDAHIYTDIKLKKKPFNI